MRRWPVIGVALGVVWLFVRGLEPTLETVLGEFVIGTAFGLVIAFVFRRFYATDLALGRDLRVVPAALRYVGYFLWVLLTANVDVAYRVLAPSMPLAPAIVVVPLRVESDAAITTIANSITLTPGTLTMDYDEEQNALYVHAIDARDPERVVAPIRRWERSAFVIFGEDGRNDPPQPTITDGGPDE